MLDTEKPNEFCEILSDENLRWYLSGVYAFFGIRGGVFYSDPSSTLEDSFVNLGSSNFSANSKICKCVFILQLRLGDTRRNVFYHYKVNGAINFGTIIGQLVYLYIHDRV